MRLFILDRTPLRCVDRLADPPRKGDVVAFLRRGQDVEGGQAAALEAGGVRVHRNTAAMDAKSFHEIQALGEAFLDRWHLDDGRDLSRMGGLSLSRLTTHDLARRTNPRHLIYTGEIIRRLVDAHPKAKTVFSDLADGHAVEQMDPEFLPLAKTAEHVVTWLGRDHRSLDAVEPLPPINVLEGKGFLKTSVKSYLGGLRPAWIRARMRRRKRDRQPDHRPVIYVFDGRGMRKIADKLARDGNIRVILAGLGGEYVDSMRHDHLFALPSLADLRCAFRLLHHLRRKVSIPARLEDFVYAGVPYGGLLTKALIAAFRSDLLQTLITVAQTRKLLRKCRFDAALINGEGKSAMGVLVGLSEETGTQMYFIRHSIPPHHPNIRARAFNNPHVTYMASGQDHREEFGFHLPETEKPRRPVVGSPMTVLMNDVRGRRSETHGKRLLVLSFGPLSYFNGARMRACDTYLVDVLKVSRALLEEGWAVSLRGRPGDPFLLERRMIEEMDLTDKVVLDTRPNIGDSLLDHDVVVSNFTTVYYQALYAGWPTIFYEPDYLTDRHGDELFSDDWCQGLLTATDIERPITSDREMLGHMVRDSLDPDSAVSVFPRKFVGEYAERFIGPRPDDAHTVIAEFIAADLLKILSSEPRNCAVSADRAVSSAGS